MKKGNTVALLPIGVFLVIYLGLGIVFEYVLKISMGFYKIPIVVAFLVALLVAISQAAVLGYEVSAFEIIPNLFYPYALLLSSLVFIYPIPERNK